MSNSAGRSDVTAAAVNIFLAAGASMMVHCGDIGGRHVLDELAPIETVLVWGDRDPDRMGLLRYAQSLGLQCGGMLFEFDLGSKKFVVVHGEDPKVLRKIVDEQQYDYVLWGHGLATEDRTVGRTRVLNPGPLHGGSAQSALLLDPETGKVRIVPV